MLNIFTDFHISLGDSIVDFTVGIYLNGRGLDFVEHFLIMSQDYLIIYPYNFILQIFKIKILLMVIYVLRGNSGVSHIFQPSWLLPREVNIYIITNIFRTWKPTFLRDVNESWAGTSNFHDGNMHVYNQKHSFSFSLMRTIKLNTNKEWENLRAGHVFKKSEYKAIR